MKIFFWAISLFFLCSCESQEEQIYRETRAKNRRFAPIERSSDEYKYDFLSEDATKE